MPKAAKLKTRYQLYDDGTVEELIMNQEFSANAPPTNKKNSLKEGMVYNLS